MSSNTNRKERREKIVCFFFSFFLVQGTGRPSWEIILDNNDSRNNYTTLWWEQCTRFFSSCYQILNWIQHIRYCTLDEYPLDSSLHFIRIKKWFKFLFWDQTIISPESNGLSDRRLMGYIIDTKTNTKVFVHFLPLPCSHCVNLHACGWYRLPFCLGHDHVSWENLDPHPPLLVLPLRHFEPEKTDFPLVQDVL